MSILLLTKFCLHLPALILYLRNGFANFGYVKAKFLETTMTGQFVSSFTLAFVGGFILAFPYVFWEFWRFVSPALSDKERKRTRGVIFWVSLLFFIGVAFGYYILTPFMVNFYFK
jgi:sec-independent protein translocase protein TatC